MTVILFPSIESILQTHIAIGLGLLGGSLAKALKAYTDYDVVGYARRQEVCDAALQDGVVSQAWT